MTGIRPAVAACGLAFAATACLRTIPVDPARLGTQALTTKVVAADGSLLTTLHAEIDRRPVPLAAMPKVLVDAVLAVEDRRFYEHDGVDVRGIARAAIRDVSSGEAAQGGSTITQQLVKNTLVTPERTLSRKVREAALAVGLERSMTKDQILERYLNTVYFGQGAYGVGAAARVYFGHGAERLSLAEAALLAGLIRSPNSADPVRNPAAATARRAVVLASMVDVGAATPEEAAAAGQEPVPRRAHRDDARFAAAYAVEDAKQQLLADPRLGPTPEHRMNALFRGGLTVRLTIDPVQQRLAEQAVAAVLTERDDPYAGVAVVKPGDGAITAMVGGRDFFAPNDPQARVNLARGGTTKRQAGSTFKVFTLVAALEAGVKLDDRFEAGARATLPRRHVKPWEVDNYEGVAFGRITLRKATESSVNTAYARVVQRLGDGDVDAGAAKVLEVADRLGVRGRGEKPLGREPAVTLGAGEVDPVQMAAAYATFAANGTYATPYLVESVTDSRGKVVLRNAPKRKQAVAPGVAMLVNDALQGVVRRGTGVRAALSRPVAGKTGTSTAYHDAWFVGYTPDLAAAVWVGVPRGQVSMKPENGFRTVIAGGTFPALIWGRFAAAALAGTPVRGFEDAAGATVKVRVDVERGCLPNPFTLPADVAERTYLKGTEPKEVCKEPTAPPATVVPALLGLTGDEAARRLGGAGFRYELQQVFDPTFPLGIVVGQSPPSGTGVAAGSTVVVKVSGGTAVDVVVPDLLGLDTDSALAVLGANGLRGVVRVAPSCTGGAACDARLRREAGRVWRQDVRAGTSARAGTEVPISVGPRYTPAPPQPTPTPTPSPSPSPSPAPSPSA